MKSIVIGVFLMGCMSLSYSQIKYPPVEELVYTGLYNWGVLNLKAGRVEFTLSPSDKYPGAQKLKAVGYTLPKWEWFFSLHDTLISHYNPQTFKPYEFSRKAHEGNYHKTFDYTFNYRDSVIHGDIHRIGKYQRKDTIALLPDTYDMLSIAWMTRELEFDKLQKNETIPIKVLIDSKIYDLYVRYLGTEKVRAGGRKVECYVFSPLLVAGEVFKDGENMKIWVSRDEYRIPVMVEAKILVGSVKGIIDWSASKFQQQENGE